VPLHQSFSGREKLRSFRRREKLRIDIW
jgi:hypothetical protein